MILLVMLPAGCDAVTGALASGDVWRRHTIDDRSSGADGVRPADVNGDGLTDLVSSWEGSGEVKVYLHPGSRLAVGSWPTARIAAVRSVEDAVFADLDGDGAFDVISSAEGGTRGVFVHWAPTDPARYLDPAGWQTEALTASEDRAQWMFTTPAQIDGRHGMDLVAGAKESGAQIGWFEAPADPRDSSAWRWHPITPAGWVMSLLAEDVDEDGDVDILATDRKGPLRGTYWYENPGSVDGSWIVHRIDDGTEEVMFMDVGDVDGNGARDVVTAINARGIVVHYRMGLDRPAWETESVSLPSWAGTAKGVRITDINDDGQADVVFSCENAGGRVGVAWMEYATRAGSRSWRFHPISGLTGSKFDVVQSVDVDGDGDRDVITTEEDAGLGVVWYENPG